MCSKFKRQCLQLTCLITLKRVLYRYKLIFKLTNQSMLKIFQMSNQFLVGQIISSHLPKKERFLQWEMTHLGSVGNHLKEDQQLLLSLKRDMASRFKFKSLKKSLRL